MGNELEQLILKKQQQTMIMGSLDYVSMQKSDNMSTLDKIYEKIAEEAVNLKDDGHYDYKIPLKYRVKVLCEKGIAIVKKIDRKLQGVSFYTKFVRRVLRKIVRMIYKSR